MSEEKPYLRVLAEIILSNAREDPERFPCSAKLFGMDPSKDSIKPKVDSVTILEEEYCERA